MGLQVGVKAFLLNQEGEVLLLHRNQRKYKEVKELWDIPGGRIEPGSTLLENLKREVREEAGVGLVGVPILLAAQDIIKTPDVHVVRLTYRAETEEEPVLGEEHDAYKWVSPELLEGEAGLDTFAREVARLIHGSSSAA